MPVGDTLTLAKKLDTVLSMKPSQKKKMEIAARQRVEKHFSIDKMCEKTLRLYKEVLR